MVFLRIFLFVLLTFIAWSCNEKSPQIVYKTDQLEIREITKNSFLHISFLDTEEYGKVACNGLLFVKDNEACVFDTPADNDSSKELIEYIEKELDSEVKAVIVNHFHADCVGGLAEFHRNNINTYCSNKTLNLIDTSEFEIPKLGFDNELILTVGNENVINSFFGEGHTFDNIVSYIPSEKVLFGGCLIKSIGSGRGNVADANVNEWSNTVQKIKSTFDDVHIVIPGHGTFGGPELLDYTIEKFKIN